MRSELTFPDFGGFAEPLSTVQATLGDFIDKLEERILAVQALVPSGNWDSIHGLGEWTLRNCRLERMPRRMINATKKQLGPLAKGMPEDMLCPDSLALCLNVGIVFGERLRILTGSSWEVCVRKRDVNFHQIVLRGNSPIECAVHRVLPNFIDRRLRGDDDRSLSMLFEIWRKILAGEGYDG